MDTFYLDLLQGNLDHILDSIDRDIKFEQQNLKHNTDRLNEIDKSDPEFHELKRYVRRTEYLIDNYKRMRKRVEGAKKYIPRFLEQRLIEINEDGEK